MSKIALAGNSLGSGTLTISAPNTSTDRVLTLPDNTGTVVTTGSTAGVSQAMLASGVAGNGPAFSAYASAGTSVSNATATVIAYATKNFDTATCYNNTGSTATLNGISVPAYSFAPNVAGYYMISGVTNSNNAPGNTNSIRIYKNGSFYCYGSTAPATGSIGYWAVSNLVYLNGTSDYVNIQLYQNSGSTLSTNNDSGDVFSGAMVRSA